LLFEYKNRFKFCLPNRPLKKNLTPQGTYVIRLKVGASRPRREQIGKMYNPEIGYWGGMALLVSSITGPGLTTGMIGRSVVHMANND
jgi:hypothetical protein